MKFLTFFCSYIHRSGEPTWLAEKIRDINDDRIHANSQRYTMVHLELFWKDDSIKPKEPKNEPTMNIFSDWGVVTLAKGMGKIICIF